MDCGWIGEDGWHNEDEEAMVGAAGGGGYVRIFHLSSFLFLYPVLTTIITFYGFPCEIDTETDTGHRSLCAGVKEGL